MVPADSVLEQAIHSTLAAPIPTDWSDATRKATARLPKSVKRANFPSVKTSATYDAIDGATAGDFDDAVFVRSLGGRRGWRLIVAIADVSHYVKPRSAPTMMRKFAQPQSICRALSCRCCQKLFQTGVLSKANVDRLALVCICVAANGDVRDFKFYDAVICSHGRLTYEQVQAHIDHGSELPVAEMIRNRWPSPLQH